MKRLCRPLAEMFAGIKPIALQSASLASSLMAVMRLKFGGQVDSKGLR